MKLDSNPFRSVSVDVSKYGLKLVGKMQVRHISESGSICIGYRRAEVAGLMQGICKHNLIQNTI